MTKLKQRTGFTLVELLVVIGILSLLIAITIPAIMKIQANAEWLMCKTRLRNIGLALHAYHNDYKHFPSGCSVSGGSDAMPYSSWCIRILPYIEKDNLFKAASQAYAKDQNFVHVPPHTVSYAVINHFLCPSIPNIDNYDPLRRGVTTYLGVEGVVQLKHDGVLFADSKISISNVLDGATHTIMVGERPPSPDGNFGWWYAGWGQDKTGTADMVLSVRETASHFSFATCNHGQHHFQPGRLDSQCSALHFWSVHPGQGANFLFVDGSVRFLKYDADKILPAIATRAGGEAVIIDD